MVRASLIELNPEIAEDTSRADEIIAKLRRLFATTTADNLVEQNEKFKEMVFDKNTFPFGENHEHIPIKYFGTEINGMSDKNRYVVTNQWVYPSTQGGKRLDIVLLVNGFPFAIGELKTPVRASISWLDGAMDINAYEQSIPQMFVCMPGIRAVRGCQYDDSSCPSGLSQAGAYLAFSGFGEILSHGVCRREDANVAGFADSHGAYCG